LKVSNFIDKTVILTPNPGRRIEVRNTNIILFSLSLSLEIAKLNVEKLVNNISYSGTKTQRLRGRVLEKVYFVLEPHHIEIRY
jgi:hypothetical protein